MKTTFQHTLLAVLLITLFASIGFAQENITLESPSYRAKGFFGSFSVGAIINPGNGCDDEDECWGDISPVLPGKLDLNVGYQFNPYVSLNARIWNFWIIVNGVELAPVVHLTDSRVSPFITGGVGAATVLGSGGAYAFAGAGLDIHFTQKANMFVQARYVTTFEDVGGLLPEIGVKFRF
ncbi:MAG: hypothetical protein IT286_03245 [Proteobacteria bacterium]|nr:hypothetical protein [Pseudomonadota bacterium]